MAKKPYLYRLNFDFKSTTGGADTYGHDMKFFGDTTGKYVHWDASADTLYVVGTLDLTGTFNSGNLALIDNETITMGTGSDINFKFDGTNLLWSKTVAAGNALKIDADTVDTTADVLALDIGVNSASVSGIKGNLDIGTALSAGEIVRGVYLDINSNASNANTSGMTGFDCLITGVASGADDLVGYKVLFDGTKNAADSTKGLFVDGDLTINNANETLYGAHFDFSGTTHTNGTIYGTYVAIPTAASGSGYGHYILCNDNTTGIYINSGSTDRTAGNVIEIDLDVNDASVSMIKGFMDWGTASTTAKTVRGLFLDFDDIASGTNGSGLIGCHMLMSGIASGNSDLVGYKTEFDGTRNQGDTAKGIHIIQNSLTINHASEYLYGSHIDFSSLTHTNGIVYGEYIDVSANVASGSNYGTYIKCATGSNSAIYIDRGTNDVTTGTAIDIDFDVNSASVNCINVDLDVGTALSSAESVVGLKLDLVGNAGDATDSAITGIYMTNAGTGTGVNRAINIDGTWDRSIEIEATAGRAEIDVEIDNAYKFTMFEDFLMPTINENDFPVILNNDGGGGADPSIAAVVARGALTCNTTGGGGANGSQVVIHFPVTANLGGLVFETSLHINTAITGCRVLAGFTDVSTWEVGASIGGGDAITTTFSDGCAFVYDDQADTDVWFAVGVAGDTDATGNGATDTAPVADTYQTLRIEISSDGSTAYFYINDVLKKTLTANAITASTSAYATVVIQETAAAAKTCDIDYIKLVHNR